MYSSHTADHLLSSNLATNEKVYSRLFQRLVSCQPYFSLCFRDSSKRKEVEQYIHNKYKNAYHADINQYMPCLMTMGNSKGINSVLGIHSAAKEALFVEQYSQLPIEQKIQKHCGKTVNREKIVEIGNLAAVKQGSSSLLIIMLTALLYHSGYHWAVFTATEDVQKITDKLDGITFRICEAKVEQLQDNTECWGDYYETNPHLIVADIRDSYKSLQRHHLFSLALQYFNKNIKALARELSRH